MALLGSCYHTCQLRVTDKGCNMLMSAALCY